MSICTMSGRSRSTAQCSGVVPSCCVAFTSTRLSMSARTRATSSALIASTIALCAPAGTGLAQRRSAIVKVRLKVDTTERLDIERLEIGDAAGAVYEAIPTHADFFEARPMEIRQRRRVLVSDVAATLEPRASSTRDDNRQVRVIVDVGIAHAAAEQIERGIQERTHALRR